MSSSSYFTLLRKSKENLQFSDKLIEEFIASKYNEMSLFNTNASTLDEMKNNLSEYYPISTFKYISLKNKNEYDVVFQFHFTSGFNVLKEEYNLNPNNKYNEIILDINTCKDMLIAINYILTKEYSYKFEMILDNYFIEVFGKLMPTFQHRFENKINSEDYDYESAEIEKEGLYYLKKVRDLLSSYILIENENTLNEAEYILLYSVF